MLQCVPSDPDIWILCRGEDHLKKFAAGAIIQVSSGIESGTQRSETDARVAIGDPDCERRFKDLHLTDELGIFRIICGSMSDRPQPKPARERRSNPKHHRINWPLDATRGRTIQKQIRRENSILVRPRFGTDKREKTLLKCLPGCGQELIRPIPTSSILWARGARLLVGLR
ncbi:MAG: hypothetical protein JJU33_11590 [Phycisphaerales bacterium]|nr:hypothetical protein [Phycisphaerales bacterium]